MPKRRANGEGNIRKRKDGRWEGRIVVGYDEKGAPITKSVTAVSKSVCQEKLEELKVKCGVVTGRARSPSSIFCSHLMALSSSPVRNQFRFFSNAGIPRGKKRTSSSE